MRAAEPTPPTLAGATGLRPAAAPPVPAGATARGADALPGAIGMVIVGSSVAVSHLLTDAPLFTAQAIRYGAAALVLLPLARLLRLRLVRPRGRDWLWLAAVAGSGLVLFNVALVRGAEHAEPAVIAVAVACVPILMALGAPLLQGRRPHARLLPAAGIVTTGAVLVAGTGDTDAAGLGWAVATLLCEAGFTLFALPVLGRLGAATVSLHSVWIAAVALAALGLVAEGPTAATSLDRGHWLATAHLAVLVTAVAFVLWYTTVDRIGADRAGLLTGVAPISAAAIGTVLVGAVPGPAVWAGLVVVGAGLALGLRPDPHHDTRGATGA